MRMRVILMLVVRMVRIRMTKMKTTRWQFSWYRTTILLLPAGGNWAHGRSNPLWAARKSSKLRENDALRIVSDLAATVGSFWECAIGYWVFSLVLHRNGPLHHCRDRVYYSWCTDSRWRGCNGWCTTDEIHLLAKPETFLPIFPCCSSSYNSMSIFTLASKVQSKKCKVQNALYMVRWCMVHWCIGVRMKTTKCCSSLEKQGCVVVLTRLRVVFHIERVERHIKMISELICGLFWSPLYSAMEPSSIQPYPWCKNFCVVYL